MEIVKCGLLFYIVECHGNFDLITATSLNKLRVTDKKKHIKRCRDRYVWVAFQEGEEQTREAIEVQRLF